MFYRPLRRKSKARGRSFASLNVNVFSSIPDPNDEGVIPEVFGIEIIKSGNLFFGCVFGKSSVKYSLQSFCRPIHIK